MPRRRHPVQPNAYFHITNRSAVRLVLFSTPADYRSFLKILNEGLQRHPARLIAYCLMPTHWHLVMGPTGTRALSHCLRWVSSTHAIHVRQARQTTAMALPTVSALVQMCRDVERLPLSARLVRQAQDWPWSSLTERLDSEPRLPLVTTPFLTSRAWVDYVNGVCIRPTRPWRPGQRLGDFTERPRRFA